MRGTLHSCKLTFRLHRFSYEHDRRRFPANGTAVGLIDLMTCDLVGFVYHYIESCEPLVSGREFVTGVTVIVDPPFGDTPGAAGFGTVRALQQLRQQFRSIHVRPLASAETSWWSGSTRLDCGTPFRERVGSIQRAHLHAHEPSGIGMGSDRPERQHDHCGGPAPPSHGQPWGSRLP